MFSSFVKRDRWNKTSALNSRFELGCDVNHISSYIDLQPVASQELLCPPQVVPRVISFFFHIHMPHIHYVVLLPWTTEGETGQILNTYRYYLSYGIR